MGPNILSKIFSSDFDYVIPSIRDRMRGQWTERRALTTYMIFTSRKDTYFLGSIVLIKEEGKPTPRLLMVSRD